MKQAPLTFRQIKMLEWHVLYHAQIMGNRGIDLVLAQVNSMTFLMAMEIVRIVNDLKTTNDGMFYLPNSYITPPKGLTALSLVTFNDTIQSSVKKSNE